MAQRTLSVYSADDAEQVWEAVSEALTVAAAAADPDRQRRLATVVVAAAAPPESSWPASWPRCCPEVAAATAWRLTGPAVQLVEAGPAIFARSSPQLIDKAAGILADLGVQVRTKYRGGAAATEEGFRLTDGQLASRAACSSGGGR